MLHHEPGLERTGKHAECILRRPAIGFRTHRRGPQRRVRVLHDMRHDIEFIEPVMPAVMGKGLFAEAFVQYGQRFVDQLPALVHAGAEYRKFQRRKSAPDANLKTAAAQNIKR